jgi:hypothetical protein
LPLNAVWFPYSEYGDDAAEVFIMSDKFTLNAVPITKQSWALILQSGDQRFIHQINLLNAKARQDFINRSRAKFTQSANIHGKSIDLSASEPWAILGTVTYF